MSKKGRIGIKIDMTPMVDVAFLLLIFFMTTTSFKPPEQVSVALPGSKSEIHVPETKTIILTVNKDGETYISDEDLSQTNLVEKADLVNAIADSPDAQRCYAQRWVQFAYARDVNSADTCTVQTLATNLTRDGYTVQNLIADLTQAQSFRFRTLEQ